MFHQNIYWCITNYIDSSHDSSHLIYRCKWVKIHGDEYRLSAGVALNVVQDMPTVGIIQDIFYIVNEEKVVLNEFSNSYEPHN